MTAVEPRGMPLAEKSVPPPTLPKKKGRKRLRKGLPSPSNESAQELSTSPALTQAAKAGQSSHLKKSVLLYSDTEFQLNTPRDGKPSISHMLAPTANMHRPSHIRRTPDFSLTT